MMKVLVTEGDFKGAIGEVVRDEATIFVVADDKGGVYFPNKEHCVPIVTEDNRHFSVGDLVAVFSGTCTGIVGPIDNIDFDKQWLTIVTHGTHYDVKIDEIVHVAKAEIKATVPLTAVPLYSRVEITNNSFKDTIGIINLIHTDYCELTTDKGYTYSIPYEGVEAKILSLPSGNIEAMPKDSTVESPNPDHYNNASIQYIEFAQANLTKEEFIGAMKFTIMKYATRMGKKDATLCEAKKIERYSKWLRMAVEGLTIDPRKD